jgi:acetyl-CoA carboxylase/biotin carboxylase 1
MADRIFGSVEEYVEFCGGNRPIKKVLIANNGNAAIKAIRSIRRWAFQTFNDERKISFVVMATKEDMNANAEYIRMADEIVDVPGGPNNNNYANVMLIVELAIRYNVDAVWAGWGHASEKDLLPDTLAATPNKIVFIGPAGAPMRALGDKIGSTIIAQSAGVSCIGWNGDKLRCDYRAEGCIPQETYDQANVNTLEKAQSECVRVGFPVMIKASEGGGGKGVRKVSCEEEVAAAYRQVQGEVPGSPIFIMKLAPRARHLEVQLLADQHGNAIALNGRDCSVQRRFQKIIEEGPPVAAKPEIWPQMEKAAVALAREVNYSNAGTVEYLYCFDDDTFAFLELNPRLQVEHPVTEMITGVNLPAAQLQVSMGIPLHGNPDIRKLYGREPFSKDPIAFDTEQRTEPNGHCIAVRITAENPDAGFQPTSGTIEELNFRSTPDVWGYFSVDSSGTVHEFADSQFGHLFAHGGDREQARKNMIMALKELSIRGDIRTTTEYIIQLMSSPDFIENRISTAWLDERLKLGRDTPEAKNARAEPLVVATVGALVTFVQKITGIYNDFVTMIKRGQYPLEDMLMVSDTMQLIYEDIKYCMKISQAGGETDSTIPVGTHGNFYIAAVDENGKTSSEYVEAKVRVLSDGGYLIHLGGRSHSAYANQEASGLRLTLDGKTCIFSKEYDPTRLTTEVAGKFVKQLVAEGAHVEAQEPFAEIEVMKMFMPVLAGEAGTVHWKLTEGAAMNAGDLMATMELDHPELVKTATRFNGSLFDCAELAPSGVSSETDRDSSFPHRQFARAYEKLETIMKGYAVPEDEYEKALDSLGKALVDPTLPVYEVEDALGPLTGRIDANLHKELTDLKSFFKTDFTNAQAQHGQFAKACRKIIDQHLSKLNEADVAAFNVQVANLLNTIQRHVNGRAARSISVLQSLVAQYSSCEREFNYADKPKPYNEVVRDLRKLVFPNKPESVFDTCRSHASLGQKNRLMAFILSQIRIASTLAQKNEVRSPKAGGGGDWDDFPSPSGLTRVVSLNTLMRNASEEGVDVTSQIRSDLSEIAGWAHQGYAKVALEARMLLIEQEQPSVMGRRAKVTEWLRGFVELAPMIETVDNGPRARKMREFLTLNIPLGDVLPEYLESADEPTQFAALELYIRRIYPLHNLKSLQGSTIALPNGAPNALTVKFNFFNDFFDASGMKTSTSVASIANASVEALTPMKAARTGVFVKVRNFDEFASSLNDALKIFPETVTSTENCLHVALMGDRSVSKTADDFAKSTSSFLASNVDKLRAVGLSRVTFLCFVESSTGASIPCVFTFRDGTRIKDFGEDFLFRNIEPSYAYHLDILRLRNFDIQLCLSYRSQVGNVQVYRGAAKPEAALAAKMPAGTAAKERFFVRGVSIEQTNDVCNEIGRMFLEALSAANTAVSEYEEEKGVSASGMKSNHIFLNVVANGGQPSVDAMRSTISQLMRRHRRQVASLGIAHVEVRYINSNVKAGDRPIRLLASDPTGTGIIDVEGYTEEAGINASKTRILKSLPDERTGIWDGEAVTSPYGLFRKFEKERTTALASSDTLYCYDFLGLIKEAVSQAWDEKASLSGNSSGKPAQLMDAVELVINVKGTPPPMRRGDGAKWDLAMAERGDVEMVEVNRPMGQNDVGMVAWLLTLRTPECPTGRQVVLISNDITFIQGSFGTREDWVFKTASEYARKNGLPRLYLAANSGARIGMANQLKAAFKVEWNNNQDPTAGYKYLYLTPEDNEKFTANNSVKTQLVVVGDETRHMITDIIGDPEKEPDLGVENLRGSGMIAGETSMAYDDIFTLTVVTGRSVGIGAYLVRLGQRTIQKTDKAPIILTGYQALNKLMGKEIYTSNDQLGGGGLIMYPNGVSHLLADDHLDSIIKAVKWLSYVPRTRGAPLPVTDIKDVDNIERLIQYEPSKNAVAPYDDPRYLIDGVGAGDKFAPLGFFDKGSFTETLAQWAQTVIVGRARLGGIPMGVIVTESRTRSCLTPADPADPNSSEVEMMQAGGVWFPDSAYKTAQALKDFKGEDLPVMIFANWRGFSGGQRDMFLEVLKFGAMIVDALVASTQPIFVYIPPFAELRGGAWVVVDSTINPNCMEFFAAENSRGGVLEATGAASIKYRIGDIQKTMRRIDPELIKLTAEHAAAVKSNDSKAIEDLALQIKIRESKVLPIYQQIAVQFADLHDTPGRMEAAGVIKAQVEWKSSRGFFYWRLRRRLAEFQLRKEIMKHDASLSPVEASALLEKWFMSTANAKAEDWADSRKVLSWIGHQQSFLRSQLESLRTKGAASKAQALALECPEGAAAGLVAAFEMMDPMQREVLRQHLAAIH